MTYHGPGQLVAYPIFDIRALGLGARAFVESLEDSVVSTLGGFVAVKEFGHHNSQQGTFAVSRHVRGLRLVHSLSAAGRWQAMLANYRARYLLSSTPHLLPFPVALYLMLQVPMA